VLPEIAVFSGDTVRMDEDGYLYFIGRRDEMIKTSGYRVSPTEVEEILYATRLVGECIAFGCDDERLGQAIHVIATAPDGGDLDSAALRAECRRRMPAYMVPAVIVARQGPLPRNPNGKIDRQLLAAEAAEISASRAAADRQDAGHDRIRTPALKHAAMDQFAGRRRTVDRRHRPSRLGRPRRSHAVLRL
jgi:acyl-coenzyme A synthetase/AMP-(fatty) acid ligase